MNLSTQAPKTDRNRFTRMCIGEAFIELLEKHSFEEIHISDICARAGVSRMTYYKYYQSKQDILVDYLQEIVHAYIDHSSAASDIGQFNEYEHILYSLNFFDQYSHFFLTLVHANLYSIIIDAINNYMVEQILPVFSGSVYQLYYYAGALLNIFITWTDSKEKEPAEKIAHIVHSFLH